MFSGIAKRYFQVFLAEVYSSAIRQKGESQNGCYRKTKHAKFPQKRTFSPPDTHTSKLTINTPERRQWRCSVVFIVNFDVCVSGGKKCSFFGKFGVLCFLVFLFCFLVTRVLRFSLLHYYRRI